MTKLSKSQKKGKFSIYNSRFLKKKKEIDSYKELDLEKKYLIVDLEKSTKSTGIIAVVKCEVTNKNYRYLAPEKIRSGTYINQADLPQALILKPLKDYKIGQKICAIEKYKFQNNYICSAGGTFATIYAHKADLNKTILLIKKRKIVLPWTNLAMKGIVSNSNCKLKPLPNAGAASRIHYAKGKKYPTVSEHKKNSLDSCIGGSYKKSKRIICVKHDTNPKRKTGHIAPSRTGRGRKK